MVRGESKMYFVCIVNLHHLVIHKWRKDKDGEKKENGEEYYD